MFEKCEKVLTLVSERISMKKKKKSHMLQEEWAVLGQQFAGSCTS